MIAAFAKFIFETSPFDPLTTALLAGFAEFGFDGRVHLTRAGESYLSGIAK